MISEKILNELNQHLNREFYSSYLYLSMSAYFETQGCKGFAHWMNLQFHEEHEHAMKFYKYINDRGGKVILHAIEKPKLEWSNSLEVFEEALKHEEFITKHINNFASLAQEEKDHATGNFLQWFVDEQVEEESTLGDIVTQLKMIGDNSQGIFLMDRELSSRSDEVK